MNNEQALTIQMSESICPPRKHFYSEPKSFIFLNIILT